MILEEGETLVLALFENLVADLVEGEGHLLVFRVGEVVLAAEVALLLVGDDLAHQLDGGIVSAAVASPSGRDRHGREGFAVDDIVGHLRMAQQATQGQRDEV